MIRAVIFDLDDTLYPERDFAFSGFAAVARAFAGELGDPLRTTERMRRLFDTEHRRRVFNHLLDELDLSDRAATLVPKMIEAYRSHEPEITLLPDARRILQTLSGQYKLGLITDGPARMQRAKLKALGLREPDTAPCAHGHNASSTSRDARPPNLDPTPTDAGEGGFILDAIIVTDELGPDMGKPHLAAFEQIAERLGVAHHESVYVADNPAKDFVAPNRLGWRTVRIIRPDGVYVDAPTAESGAPQQTIASLDELATLLDHGK